MYQVILYHVFWNSDDDKVTDDANASDTFNICFLSASYFSPIFCFLLFNTMDFLGRSLSVIEWVSLEEKKVYKIRQCS